MHNIEIPIVTIILTVFTRTDFLEQSIQSVVEQSFSSWECIISDDAPTPEAKEICLRFSDDQRIRYRRNEVTLGTPLNVAAALREARGEYVTILNDDDLLYPQILKSLVVLLEEHPDATLAFGNHDVMDVNAVALTPASDELMRTRGRHDLKPGMIPNSLDFAVRCGLMVVMGCLFRKSACDTKWLVPEVAGAYDYWLTIKLGEQGDFVYTPEKVMAWRRHDDSLSSSPSPAAYASEIYIYETLSPEPLSPPLEGYVKQRLAECLYSRGIFFLESGRSILDARNFFYQSWRTHWTFEAFRYWTASFLPSRIRQIGISAWRTIRLQK
jgi:glycosyltransferase involved in cell wall biosynthesis